MRSIDFILEKLPNIITSNNLRYQIEVYSDKTNLGKKKTNYVINWLTEGGDMLLEEDQVITRDLNDLASFKSSLDSLSKTIKSRYKQERLPSGRPSKMTQELVDALERVIYGSIEDNPESEDEEMSLLSDRGKRALYLTNEQLVFLLNFELEDIGHPELKISMRVFERYIANHVNRTESYYSETTSSVQLQIIEKFSRLIQFNLINQRIRLLEEMQQKGNSTGWQRFAWILERKFEDFNLKTLGSLDLTNKGDKFNENDDIYQGYTVDQLKQIRSMMVKLRETN